jgi:hypothetical protein
MTAGKQKSRDSWGPGRAVDIVSPFHPHKGLSGANEAKLAAVPPRAG